MSETNSYSYNKMRNDLDSHESLKYLTRTHEPQEILKDQVFSRLYKRYGLEFKPTGKKIADELTKLAS